MSMSHLKISILSDFLCFREGIKALLAADEGLVVVQELNCTLEAIEQVRIQVPHIVIYDYHSCSHKVLDALMILRPIAAFSKIIVIWAPSREFVIKGVEIEAYHSVEQSIQELKALIWKIAAGYRPTNLNRGGLVSETWDYLPLTKRELQIAKYVVRGKTSKEIADILCITYKTVEVHRYNILKKLHLSNTSSLVNLMTMKQNKDNQASAVFS